MSGSTACRCRPRSIRIIEYRMNHSAFSGYRATTSDYSCVQCNTCGAVWRTKAAYVDSFVTRKDPVS